MAHSIVEQSEKWPYVQRLCQLVFFAEADFGRKIERLFADETAEFGLKSGFLSRIDLEAETQQLEVVHAPHGELVAGNTVPLSATYCRKTIADPEETVVVDDAPAEGWEDDPAYETFELGTYVGTTVAVRDRLYGTLCFANPDPRGEPITTEERRLVEMQSKWVAYELARLADSPVNGPVIAEHAVGPEQLDVMIEALRSQARRSVLWTLLDGTATSVDRLEQSIDAENAGVQLYHSHLPKLDQAGYIEWHGRAQVVTRGMKFFEIEPLLRFLQDYATVP